MSSDRSDSMAERPRRRELQAEQTRRELVAAARRLFAERGYAATSVKDIAGAAGVSVQTVYDSVGSKGALALALNDELDRDAGVMPLVQAAWASDDIEQIVGLPARITRSIIEHAGDIVRILTSAASSESGAA